MPRNYVRKTDKTAPNPETLLAAVKEVRVEKKFVKTVADAHSIGRTSFYRILNKVDEAFKDVSKVADEKLLEFIKSINSVGSPGVCCFLLSIVFDSIIRF